MNNFERKSLFNYLSLKGYNNYEINNCFKIIGLFKDSYATNKEIFGYSHYAVCSLVCYIDIKTQYLVIYLKNSIDDTKINIYQEYLFNIQAKDIKIISKNIFEIAKIFLKLNKGK